MEELIRQLEEGEFEQNRYTLKLKSGVHIWTANGSYGLAFEPKAGNLFTFWEKRRLMKAIKKGRIKQALTIT